MKVLFVGAHPDDAEIFAFGSLLAWKAMGAEVALAVATDGAAGGQQPPPTLRAVRRAEAEAAAAPLGTLPHFLDFPEHPHQRGELCELRSPSWSFGLRRSVSAR